MGGYVHKPWAEMKRHPYQKMTNLQDDAKMSREAFDDSFPTRRLANWEQFELRDFCAEKGLAYPPIEQRTLENFRTIVGRDPTPV